MYARGSATIAIVILTALAGVFGVHYFSNNDELAVGAPSIIFPIQGGTGTSTVPTAGQLLIGNGTNARYDVATLTAGTGISVVNADGSITVSSSAGEANWTFDTTFNELSLTPTTTIPLWMKDTIYASSTVFINDNAGGGTTLLRVGGGTTIGSTYMGVTAPSSGLAVAGTVNIGNSSLTDQLGVHNSSASIRGLYVRNTNTGNTSPTAFLEDSYTGATNTNTRSILDLYRDDNDNEDAVGISFSLTDSAGNQTEVGGIAGRITNVTNPTEKGELVFYTTDAGSSREEQLQIGPDQAIFGEDASGNFALAIDKADTGTASYIFRNAGTDNVNVQLDANETFNFQHRILDEDITFKVNDSTNGINTYIGLSPSNESIGLNSQGSSNSNALLQIGNNNSGSKSKVYLDKASGATSGYYFTLTDGATEAAALHTSTNEDLVIENFQADKDIIFEVLDGAVQTEIIRLDGDLSTLVINEGADGSVDTRIESKDVPNMFFLDSSVNRLGIATGTPAVRLHVLGVTNGPEAALSAGTVAVFEDQSVGGAAITILTDDAEASKLFFGDDKDEDVASIRYDHSTNDLIFDTGLSVDQMVIDQFGQVGIGITDPADKLHILGTTNGTDPSFSSATQLIIEDQFSGGAGLTILAANNRVAEINFADPDSGTQTRLRHDHSTDTMTFRVGGTDGLSINASGNVTIGNSLFLNEQAAADADIAGDGQIWVKNDTPNTLWFTNDAGTDVQLGVGAKSTVLGWTSGNGTFAADVYTSPFNSNTQNATETNVDDFLAPYDMTCTNLHVSVSNAPGVAPDAWDITLRDDAVNTTLTCNIPATGNQCSDTVNTTATIAQGSRMTWFIDETNSAAGTRMGISMDCTAN